MTERTNLFEPYAHIGFLVTIAGDIECEQLEEAVHKAYRANTNDNITSYAAADTFNHRTSFSLRWESNL